MPLTLDDLPYESRKVLGQRFGFYVNNGRICCLMQRGEKVELADDIGRVIPVEDPEAFLKSSTKIDSDGASIVNLIISYINGWNLREELSYYNTP